MMTIFLRNFNCIFATIFIFTSSGLWASDTSAIDFNEQDLPHWAKGVSAEDTEKTSNPLIEELLKELAEEGKTVDTTFTESSYVIDYDQEHNNYYYTFPASDEEKDILKAVLFFCLHVNQNKQSVLGNSDRRCKVDNPREGYHGSIGRIFFYEKNYKKSQSRLIDWGTGFVVGPRRYVLTAAHCLLNIPDDNETPLWFVTGITPQTNLQDNIRSIDIFKAKQSTSRIHQNYVSPEDHPFDIGLFKTLSPIPKSYASFGLCPLISDKYPIMGSVTGYPCEAQEDSTARNLYTHTGKIFCDQQNDERLLTYAIDTSGGQSGSPVYFMYQDNPYAIGVHTRGRVKVKPNVYHNRGVRLTRKSTHSNHGTFDWIGQMFQELENS